MRDTRPSRTAAWVAAARSGLGVQMPEGTRLCDDPYGMLFANVPLAGLSGLAMRLVSRALLMTPALRSVLWLQLRTRYLDDALLAFIRRGGRQVVILGAGFDCRAIRFASALQDSVVFEVDHPATQAYKLDVLRRGHAPPSPVRFVQLNFEKQSAGELPALLAGSGHDPHKPTLTIWEGVTMYLTEPAIEASVAAIRAYSAPGSELAVTYFDTGAAIDRRLMQQWNKAVVAIIGEPWRWGWDSAKLADWFTQRGFELREIAAETELARQHLPPRYAQLIGPNGRRIALVAVK